MANNGSSPVVPSVGAVPVEADAANLTEVTAELRAAAVPVATPGLAVERVRSTARAMLGWCDDPSASPAVLGSILTGLPVAQPVDEVACPNCEATIRARMSDELGPVRVSVVPGDGRRPLGGLTAEATPDGAGSLEVLVPEPVVLAWASNIEHARGARSGWTQPAEQDGQR